jgi:hypothetical protein
MPAAWTMTCTRPDVSEIQSRGPQVTGGDIGSPTVADKGGNYALAGFWTTRMSRFYSGPYRSSGFNSRLASSFVPRLSGAESGCSRISTSISSCSPHARGKRKRRPISSQKIERRAIRRTQEYVTTQSYAIENAIEMIRFLQKPLEFGRLLIK